MPSITANTPEWIFGAQWLHDGIFKDHFIPDAAGQSAIDADTGEVLTHTLREKLEADDHDAPVILIEPDGRLTYPDFIETVVTLVPMYWVRLVGGSLFWIGALLCLYNLWRTMRAANSRSISAAISRSTYAWSSARAMPR